MVKLWVVWLIPEDRPWRNGGSSYHFKTYRAACEFCREYTDGNEHPVTGACIDWAEVGVDRNLLVRDGHLVCAECGVKLDDIDSDGYALCSNCGDLKW